MIDKEKIFKYRVRLSKNAGSVTHHEKRRVLRSALEQSGLPCALSKGGARFSLGPGAEQDEASLCEYVDICLTQPRPVSEIKTKIAACLKGGFNVEEVKEVPFGLASVEVLAAYAKYIIKGVKAADKPLSADKACIEVLHGNGIRQEVSLKPFIYSINKISVDEVEIIIKLDALRSYGLGQMLSALPGLEVRGDGLLAKRAALLWQYPGGGLEPL